MKCRIASLVAACLLAVSVGIAQPVDRHALVSRHNPVLRTFDVESPLTVGNGNFAFTVDATGLQTFHREFEKTTPLGTLSHWGWHTSPNPNGWNIDDFEYSEFESGGRRVGYADVRRDRGKETEWLRSNPHRLHLGRIGFRLTKADGTPATASELTNIEQTLDLWNGAIKSRFELEGELAEVRTVCHPTLDLIAVQVTGPLVALKRIGVELHFPYGTGDTVSADWTRPDAHNTNLEMTSPNRALFERKLDDVKYYTLAEWSTANEIREIVPHQYLIQPTGSNHTLWFVCFFATEVPSDEIPAFLDCEAQTADHWNKFWQQGGAIDLSGSRDTRWHELERRIVLSQYLTAIQCSGRFPPAETGLTYNSWYGKFHLEMHWWHAVHFALWNRPELLNRSLDYYQAVLSRAQQTARRQGYRGARWPKMTDPSGAESPSGVGPFLVWQQPHPIYYAELSYRAHPNRETLQRFQNIVFETAEFMASFPNWDDAQQRYFLGPTLQGAQEEFPKDRTINLAFELTYWRWGLETAQTWRERLGLPREPNWDRILTRLSRPATADGKYLFAESAPDSYTNRRWRNDHPAVFGAFGMLPGPGIDLPTMSRTSDWVWDNWNWPDTWGWDYPLVAMNAARLGKPARAVDALLMDTPKNHYRPNGHNHQRPGLTIYLPGNGGLLAAVAMMAAGWDGTTETPAPGFPDDGTWQVRWENLRRMP